MNRFSTGLWRSPDFMRLWIGQTLSEVGSRVTREGFTLIAVLVLAASPAQLSILNVAATLPILLFGLFVGVWVDRLPRRPILIAVDTIRLLLLLTIPLAWFAGVLRIELVYVVAAAMGILGLVFESAYRAFVPSLVSRDQLIEANSKLATTDALAEIGGPAIAGALVQAVGAPLALLLDAFSYLFSILGITSIRTREPARVRAEREYAHPRARARREIAAVLGELADGLRVITRQPIVRVLVFGMAIRAFFGSFFAVLYSYFIITELGLNAAALGFIISTGGIGALAGAAIAQHLPARWGLGRVLIGTLTLGALANLLIPVASGPLWLKIGLLIASQIIGDAAMTVYEINELSLRQWVIPDRLLGRANGSIGFLAGAMSLVGALVVGQQASALGARAVLWVAALSILMTALLLLYSPVRAQTALRDEETRSEGSG